MKRSKIKIENLDQVLALPKEYAQIALRQLRETECFPYVNRGELYFNQLSDKQKAEISQWYTDWLNVTETLKTPTRPSWLK